MWLLVEEPEMTPQKQLVRGTVTCYSPDQAEVYRVAIERKSKLSRMLYTGKMAYNLVFVL
jgi:hypothetical protein